MASDPTRLLFRADSPDAYAAALLALIRLARAGSDDFRFGPLRLADCDRDGLSVIGPDLYEATAVLAAIAGLAQVEQ